MYDSELAMYEEALDLNHPWRIVDRHFSKEAGRLNVYIKVDTSNTFTCSACNTAGQPFYDIDKDEQTWRHLDFF